MGRRRFARRLPRAGSLTSPPARRRAAGAPMSGPVQRRSADVWRRAGDAAPARRCSRAPTADGDVRLSAQRPALLIAAGGGAARY